MHKMPITRHEVSHGLLLQESSLYCLWVSLLVCLERDHTCRISQSGEPSPLGLPRGDLSPGATEQLVVGGGGIGAHAAHETPHLAQQGGWRVESDELSRL